MFSIGLGSDPFECIVSEKHKIWDIFFLTDLNRLLLIATTVKKTFDIES